MRLRHHGAPALLLLLHTLRVLATLDATDAEDSHVARAAVLDFSNTDPEALNAPTLASKATKDAPVDGLDGKPHEGPWVDDRERPPAPKGNLQPAVVEDLGQGGSQRSSTKELTKAELEALGADADGVMDDPDRPSPKGNTGTEGGVSAKDKDRKAQEGKTGEKLEQVPQPPKEPPPHPQGEQETLEEEDDTQSGSRKPGAPGLEKPADLPDTPHDIPHPVPPSLGTDLPKDPSGVHSPPRGDGDQAGVIQPFHSFVLSFAMIIFSEIGDKTFLVAALMAMRHPRLVVFSAAFCALIAMTVLSAVLGHAVPTLIPERVTHFAAAALFAVFGVKLLREGLAMSPDEGVGEEMREVEQELEEKEHLARRGGRRKSSISPYVLESGRARRSRSNSRLPAPARSPSSSPARSPSPNASSLSSIAAGLNNLFSLLLSPAWVQTFVMTFLGEWGDRSQIATIAMAAGSDYWWVTGGAVVGHGCCTAVAVLGGRAIAGKVSMRVVTLGGAIAFLVFAVIYLLETIYHE